VCSNTPWLSPPPCCRVPGALFTDLVVGLGTVDGRARVSHFGFNVNDPAVAMANTNWRLYSQGVVLPLDESIHLGYSLGELDPGAATEMLYAFSLSQVRIVEHARRACVHVP
jgi:hypothetical protein